MTTTPALWTVQMVEAERHDGFKGEGIVVEITDGHTSSVIARVAYDRGLSLHPWRTFKRQLRDAIRRANQEADRMNAPVT